MLNNLKKVLANASTSTNRCVDCQRTKAELERIKEENIRLNAELRRLKTQRANSVPIGAHTPPSQIPFKEKKRKDKEKKEIKDTKGGGKAGHKGFGRESIKTEEATKVIKVPAPEFCSACNQETIANGTRKRSIIDVPDNKVEKIIYECDRSRCKKCGVSFSGKLPALPKCLYGNRLLAKVAVMYYLYGIPLGRIKEIYGKHFKTAAIINALHKLAEIFKPIIPTLIQQFKDSLVRFSDETSWNTDGEKGWIWLFSTDKITLLCCENTRSASIVEKIFGTDELIGFLVVDRYAGYNKVKCFIQFCYAHLLRDVKKLLTEFPDSSEVLSFVNSFVDLLAQAMRLQKSPISDEQYFQQAKDIKLKITTLVNTPHKHLGIKSIQNIFTENACSLYHWVENRNVPAHNNFSEQQIRRSVISRKVSFGSQSKKGADTRSILYSILDTVKKRLLPEIDIESWLTDFLNAFSNAPNPENFNPEDYFPDINNNSS